VVIFLGALAGQISSQQMKKCSKCAWALNNLRPYSAKQNNKDGNRR
jgi:hypothetical protein